MKTLFNKYGTASVEDRLRIIRRIVGMRYDDFVKFITDILDNNIDYYKYDNIVLGIHTGYSAPDGVTFLVRNSTTEILYGTVLINYPNYDYKSVTISTYNRKLSDEEGKKLEKVFDKAFKERAYKSFIDGLKKCNIDINVPTTIRVDYYDKYEKNKVVEWTGFINELFDKYNSANDSLRYCNGSYYRFSNPVLQELFSRYVNIKGGVQYYISEAVKRGALID